VRAVVLAGGRGERLSLIKPIISVCGTPILERIVNTLSSHAEVWVATVSNHPVERFARYYLGLGDKVILTKGEGYEKDVVSVVTELRPPLLTLPGDIPFITWGDIETLLSSCKASLCTIRDSSGAFTGVSLWRDLDYETSFQDVFLGHELINVNDWNTFLQANKRCK